MFLRNGPIGLIFHTLFILFILAPIIMVCAVAFTGDGFISLPVNGLSLRWFKAILNNPRFMDAFVFSLGLGLISASIAIVIAIPSALATARYQFRGREALMAFFLSPLMIPHIVLGLAFLKFFTSIGVSGTYFGGWVIAFITSFDELTMSIFIASPSTTTLPVRIFLHIEDTIDPLVTAVSAALIYITMIAIFILDRAIGLEKLFVGKGRA